MRNRWSVAPACHLPKSVTCKANHWLVGFCCLSLVLLSNATAQQARPGATAPQDCLAKALAQFVGDAAFAAELKRHVVLNPQEALASGEKGGSSLVVLVRRMPDQLDARQRRELVRQRAVDELFKLRALKSAPVKEALTAFQFPELLGDFGLKRLLETVKGQIAPGTPSPDFVECGDCFGIVLRVPNAAVQLEFVRLISDQETRVAYVSTLMRAAKGKIQTGEPQVAGRYLAEAGKLGYRSKEFFVSLYKCQARSGNQAESEKAAKVLVEQYAAGLSFDDCLELGQAADAAQFPSQSATWNRLADSKIREALAIPEVPSKR